jgi:hypothetical protein
MASDTIMALLSRIYFNAVFGALGGLVGWMLFGVFGDPGADDTRQWLVGGAIIGGSIGYFVVSVEAIRDRALVRFSRLASYGLILGAAGGALGLWLGEHINFMLMERFTGRQFLIAVLARGAGWLVLGLAVGLSEGIAARSLGKISYGSIGGALGGFIGGSLFAYIYMWALEQGPATMLPIALPADSWAALAGAAGLIILGACIGALSALVQGVFQPASVRVLRGWQEGREYPLDKATNQLGRDEGADIALFRDMKVEKRHALICRDGDNFVLHNRATPEQTQVNGTAVAESCLLEDGDRIQVGDVILRFQRKAARAKQRSVSPLSVVHSQS